jgi:hypothetical protein
MDLGLDLQSMSQCDTAGLIFCYTIPFILQVHVHSALVMWVLILCDGLAQ